MRKSVANVAMTAAIVIAIASPSSAIVFGMAGGRPPHPSGGSRAGSPVFLPGAGFAPGGGFAPGNNRVPCPTTAALRCFQAGSVSEAYPDDEDGIENLHFRVQEPFGPWDIGSSESGNN